MNELVVVMDLTIILFIIRAIEIDSRIHLAAALYNMIVNELSTSDKSFFS